MALRVLLADESTTIKKVMQLALQDFAVEVKSVQSGVDVVEVAKTFQPDIIFVDVLLQKKNGYEVCADVKREESLKSSPLVLMWSSFMDLDERLAQMSGCDRRLEKPFDVENLRQIVLELVPKTRSQRLAHFLKFPENLTDGLKAEEHAKSGPITKPPPVDRGSERGIDRGGERPPPVDRPEESLRPPPVERQPDRRAERPPERAPEPPPERPRETKRPQLSIEPERTLRPPPVERETYVGEDHDTGFDEVTKRSITAITSPPAQITMPKYRIDEDPNELAIDIDEEPLHDHGSDAPQKPTEPRSNWNMESFEEIADFTAGSGGPELVPDSDDDGGFKEVRIAGAGKSAGKKSGDTPEPQPEGRRKLSPEDRDPWSHQDLARFKLDLPPIESDDGENQVQLDVEGMEPNENSNFLHRRENTARREAGTRDPREKIDTRDPREQRDPRQAAPRSRPIDSINELPNVIELEDYGDDDRQSGSGVTASGIDIDDLEIEEEIPVDPGLALHDERAGSKKSGAAGLGPTPSLDADHLEQIIRSQSREIIEAVVRRIVPDLASDIIRKELQRLLEDSAR